MAEEQLQPQPPPADEAPVVREEIREINQPVIAATAFGAGGVFITPIFFWFTCVPFALGLTAIILALVGWAIARRYGLENQNRDFFVSGLLLGAITILACGACWILYNNELLRLLPQ